MRRVFVFAFAAVALSACAAQPGATTHLPPAPPSGEPAGIAGLQSQQLRIAFGPPAFVRKDSGAEIWRYDGAGCRAFFFLYPDQSGMSVQHVETIPRPGDAAADSGCLNRLRIDGKPVA
ncbi:MAG TPA: hypothetical protein VG309_08160 [Rhizomicrobium sp.]|jgi:hypothetical protein|nr:hypothetical protein [Rhizomicrobium sp.]